MEEFTDLINKLLEGFNHTHPEAEKIKVNQLDTFEDTDGCKYLSVNLQGSLPKKALDEIRQMGFSIYHISSEETFPHETDYSIGFYQSE